VSLDYPLGSRLTARVSTDRSQARSSTTEVGARPPESGLDHHKVALVPGVLALLPEYAGLTDPVADLRRACMEAVGRLTEDVTVLGYPQGDRVAQALLDSTPDRVGDEPSYLLVGNGTARRSEKAPGHLDDRAEAYDDELLAWLTGRGPAPDAEVGGELLAELRGPLAAVERLGPFGEPAAVDYDDDPFGVRYWVLRWER
jgi:hypothetical protein